MHEQATDVLKSIDQMLKNLANSNEMMLADEEQLHEQRMWTQTAALDDALRTLVGYETALLAMGDLANRLDSDQKVSVDKNTILAKDSNSDDENIRLVPSPMRATTAANSADSSIRVISPRLVSIRKKSRDINAQL